MTKKKEGVSKRGFAAMDLDRRLELARKGGKSVPKNKRKFFTDPDFAAECGRKGGTISRRN